MNQTDPLLDFRNFLFLVWAHLGMPTPTKRQYSIAYYLQHGPRRKIIMAFRGVGKSWVTAAFVCWLLYTDPQLNILVVSASKGRADNFTIFCQQLINEIPELQHLRSKPEQRNSRIEFDVGPAEADQNPSVKSVGINGQIAGSRADVIIADDIEVPNNSATQMMREKLATAVQEFDAVLKPNGSVIYLGTPQTESSIYNVLQERGYVCRIWPAQYPNESFRQEYGSRLDPEILSELLEDTRRVGHSTESTRFTDADLMERRLSYGRAGFAMQFMLSTRLSDADRYPLKLSDLLISPLDAEMAPIRSIWSSLPEYILSDLPNVGIGNDRLYRPVPLEKPEYAPYTGVVMAIDPSGRGKDETAYAIVAILNSTLYLLDSGGFQDGFGPETLTELAKAAKRYGVRQVIIEKNYGGGMFTQLFKPVLNGIHPCAVEEVNHSKQKELRIIDTLEPVISSHRLVVSMELVKKDYESTSEYPTETAQRYQLFYQLTRITRDKGSLAQDDRLDALSIAVAFWAEQMAQDVDKAVERHRAKMLKQELKRFEKNVFTPLLRETKKRRERLWGRRV